MDNISEKFEDAKNKVVYPIFAIRDNKANIYSAQLFIQQNDETGIRFFSFLIANDKSDPMRMFAPSDYDLYRVGNFNVESGQIYPENPAKFIVNGGNVVVEK